MQASPVQQKSFLWNVPGKRVAVDLRLPIVDQIIGEAVEGMQSDGRGIEAGGLLLGRVRRDGGLTVVEINEAEPIYCEHVAGPSLMLSASDRQGLETRLKQRRGSVVGFYRTNTRREFAVTMEDVALMSWYFSRSTDVFLLAHTSREEPLRAAFVTWEGRSLGPKSPADEFPFTSAELERQSHELIAPVRTPPPPSRRKAIPAGPWIAAAVIAVGLAAGAMFEGLRPTGSAPTPPILGERVAPPKTVPPTAEVAVRPEPPTAPALEPEPPAVEETPAEAPPAPPEPKKTIVAERPAPVPPPQRVAPAPVAVTKPPAPAPSRTVTPPPVVTPQPARSADRHLQEFVPPPAPRAVRAETRAMADLPSVAPPVRTPAAPLLSVGAAPPPPAPAAAKEVVAPAAAESTVTVAVDAMSRVRAAKFVPPTAVRQARPQVPAELRQRITRDVLINVRVYVDRAGKVEFAELLSDGTGENRELAALAVFASRKWQFAPANRDGKPVPAQAVLRFRFAPDGR